MARRSRRQGTASRWNSRSPSSEKKLLDLEQAVLDDILPEAFAAVREASRRVNGQRHFDVQLMAGIVLHDGKIAEMRTGEGKTLGATLPLYLNALSRTRRASRHAERLSLACRRGLDGSRLSRGSA